ncbi:hypothetical protein ACFZBB_32425, partial [Streptomyces sp. NPDC008139]
MRRLEISDLITAVDSRSGGRVPVRRAEVIRRLRESGDEPAARIVAGLPADQDGVLDPHAVDSLLITVHTELQRLSEELRIGEHLVHVLGLRGPEVSGQAPNRVVLNKETRKKWRHPVSTRR